MRVRSSLSHLNAVASGRTFRISTIPKRRSETRGRIAELEPWTDGQLHQVGGHVTTFADNHLAHYKGWTILVARDEIDNDWGAQACEGIHKDLFSFFEGQRSDSTKSLMGYAWVATREEAFATMKNEIDALPASNNGDDAPVEGRSREPRVREGRALGRRRRSPPSLGVPEPFRSTLSPMRLGKLRISGFRGVKKADVLLREHCVFVGPNGCGKSTLIDAMALVLGRHRIVRQLTEHDFHGSKPAPTDRIKIVVTLLGFADDDPDRSPDWFRAGRAVPKWMDDAGTVQASQAPGRKLCAEIGFAARFDHDELVVETMRYFHDGGADIDPFDDSRPIEQVPARLVNDLGFFVLPARRGWEGTASFASDLFRKTVSNAAGLPAKEILTQRDLVRDPPKPIESSAELAALVGSMNDQLARLLIDKPEFKLRLTSGDSEGVLQALLPHYASAGVTLPVSRHGSGLLSLQTLLLLLEVGRARRKKGLPFILALEEPELHLAPGLQGRLVADAISISDQTICTTHAPSVALMYPATSTLVLAVSGGSLSAAPVLEKPLDATASNDERKLHYQGRSRFLSALMHPFILVPEGRFDWEWLERLAACAEPEQKATPFSTVFGIAPTENGGVKRMSEIAKRLRPLVVPLVDGDGAGDGYAKDIAATSGLAEAVVQWPTGWTIEDVVGWIVDAGGKDGVGAISTALDGAWAFNTAADLALILKAKNDTKAGTKGLKEDMIAHDAIIASLSVASRARAALVLDALTSIALGVAHPNYTVESVGPPLRARFVPS